MAEPTAVLEQQRRFLGLRLEWAGLLCTLVLVAFGFMVLTPFILLLISSFQLSPPGRPPVYGVDGWVRAFTDPTIGAAFGYTITLSVIRQGIATIVGILLAWLIARTDLPWKGGLEFLFWISFFLPALPVTMGWILLLDERSGLINVWANQLFGIGPLFNIYSYWGIIWVHLTASTIGVKVLLLAPAFRNLDAALEETSRSCGATTLGTLFRVVVPLMAPSIFVATILGLIRSLEAFEVELLLGVPIGIFVYSTKIRDLVAYEPPSYAPATALGLVFLVVLLGLLVLQRWYLSNKMYRTISGRGFSTRATSLGSARWPVFSVVLALALVCTFIPVAVLGMGTFMRAFGYFNIPDPWTMAHWERVLRDPLLMRSIVNTLIVGAGTAIGGVVIYGLVAYIIVKTRYAARGAFDLLSWLPHAIPGILLGLALLWTTFRLPFLIPLYGTVWLLILALIIQRIPVGVQITKSVLMQLGDELEEASRISGGSWLQTYRRVVVPLMMPTFVVVGILGFLGAARDISTIVLLGSAQSRTIALLALDFAFGGQFEKATVVSVIMVAIVIVGALLARAFGGQLGVAGSSGR